MKWCCRDGGFLGKVLNTPVIQTVPDSVVSLPMISLLSEEAGLQQACILAPPAAKINSCGELSPCLRFVIIIEQKNPKPTMQQ